MIERKILWLLAVFMVAHWCSLSQAESKRTLSFGKVRCAENMSCISSGLPMSFAIAEGPKMSMANPGPAIALRECTGKFDSRPINETIEICESYLNQRSGPARDRAVALYYLGHAYSRSRLASANSGKVTETKPYKLWSKAAETDPAYIEPILSMGTMLGWSGEPDLAQAAFDRAEKMNPRDWRVFTGRANSYFYAQTEIGIPLAMLAAEKAAAIKPDEPYVKMVYGRMLQINGRYEDAAKQYEAAVGRYDPERDTSLELMREPDPLQSLAFVYDKMERPALAAETLGKYIAGRRDAFCDYTLLQERGEYYERAGIFAKAAVDFKDAALCAPPEYAEDLISRQAVLLAKAGAKLKAGEELRSVLARGNLRPVLKVQVFLRNQGYTDVTINGKYDVPTKRALDACLLDKDCAPGVGQAI